MKKPFELVINKLEASRKNLEELLKKNADKEENNSRVSIPLSFKKVTPPYLKKQSNCSKSINVVVGNGCENPRCYNSLYKLVNC